MSDLVEGGDCLKCMGSKEGESLQGESVKRDKRFLTQKRSIYVKGRKWPEMSFFEEE
jgi:hypothetical protein